MAVATIDKRRFETSRLPAVCALSGLPAAETFSFRFGEVRGGLPVNASAVRVITRLQTLVRVLLVTSLGMFLLAVVLRSFMGWSAFALVSTSTLILLGMLRSRLPVGRVSGDQIHLRNVHSSFVRALTAPPGPCVECPSASSCSTEEMNSCDGHLTSA